MASHGRGLILGGRELDALGFGKLGGCQQQGDDIKVLGGMDCPIGDAYRPLHGTHPYLHFPLLAQEVVEAAQACAATDNHDAAGEVCRLQSGVFYLGEYVLYDFSRAGVDVVVDLGVVDAVGSGAPQPVGDHGVA